MDQTTSESKSDESLNSKIASWIIFFLVIGVIGCTLTYMIGDLFRSPIVHDLVIRYEPCDSLHKASPNEMVCHAEKMDSLIHAVREHELALDEKYQYLVDSRQEEDRFKTWGALIVGVIVSICGFWGYKSLKDLRDDIKENTEKTSELAVNSYLEKNLQNKVNESLNSSLRSDIVDIIKTHVFNTLNSSEDPIVNSKVRDALESDSFERELKKKIHDEVVNVVEDMILQYNKSLKSNILKTEEGQDSIQLT